MIIIIQEVQPLVQMTRFIILVRLIIIHCQKQSLIMLMPVVLKTNWLWDYHIMVLNGQQQVKQYLHQLLEMELHELMLM